METWTSPSKGHSVGTMVTLTVFSNLVFYFPHSLCLTTEKITWKEQCPKMQFNFLSFSNTFKKYLLSA